MRSHGLAVLCVAVGLLAARAANGIGRFEDAGVFRGRGKAMSRLAAPGPGGRDVLYVCYTYMNSLDLVAHDPVTHRSRVWRHPEGGAWAMEAGPDGRIYLGTYMHGRILRLNPATGRLDDLGQAIAGEEYVWQLSLGPDGMLYGCTFPNAHLFRLDPRTGKVTDLGRMDPVQQYNRSIMAARDGWVYCGIGTERADIVAYRPATGERRSLIPDAERAPGSGKIYRGADGYAYAMCLDRVYALRDGGASRIERLPALHPRTLGRDGVDIPESPDYRGRELPIFRVAEGPDGCVYGSSILPEYLLRYDPARRRCETLGLIEGAEAYSMLSAGGRLYIASYGGATLQAYDPAQPFRPALNPAGNPAYYGSLAPRQDRPYDITRGADGRIYAACVPGYGYHGGALAWFDPATSGIGYDPSPVADQAIASVCALPDGRIACATSTEGGPGTTPRATEAALFVWDPAARRVEWRGVPLRGAERIGNLARGGDGLIYGTAGRRLFVFDPAARTVLSETTLDRSFVVRAGLHTLADGRVVAICAGGACLVRYQNGAWSVRWFAESRRELGAGKAAVGGWLYAATRDSRLVRCRIPAR